MKNSSLLILGRHPEISLAELRAVFPEAKFVSQKNDFVIVENLDAGDVDLRKIGGVIKVGRVFYESVNFVGSKVEDFLVEKLADRSGKQNFGVSVWGGRHSTLKTLLIGAKKALKAAGVSVRFVNKNFQNLDSAQTEFEIVKKDGVEIMVATDRKKWWFAELTAVQPFAEYAKRDYEKVARDARVGMLPPKLSQTMINLAVGSKQEATIYDPFCGTGTVLIEAILMGHKAVGSDIDPRMVEYSQKNLKAMDLSAEVFVHDAIRRNNTKCDAVVTEGYLGPPRRTIPNAQTRQGVFRELTELYEKFFSWIKAERVVITFPFYVENGKAQYYSSGAILPKIKSLGWVVQNESRLSYYRENQVVGREIVVLAPAGLE